MAYPGYNFEHRFLAVRGHRMHYLDEGPVDGEPVVMVHGNPTWSFFFRGLVERLSDRYRTVVPDHIGMGLSATPPESAYTYTLKSRVDDLETLLESRGVVDDITLVVHDWGGSIGLGYALRHPERVKRLVILNTAAFHLPEGKDFPASLKVVRTPLIGSLLVRGGNAFSREAVNKCSVKPLPTGVKQAYLEPYNDWRNRLAVMRFVQDIPLDPKDRAYDLISEIEESIARYRELPVMICWGTQDYIFDTDILDEWVRRLPEAELHRYEQAGHYILEDVGVDVAARIRDFLNRHPLDSSGAGNGGG
jgi:haloalkane dehalogenase